MLIIPAKHFFLDTGWNAPDRIGHLITTRMGGVSTTPYDSCNLSFDVGDIRSNVEENRQLIQVQLPGELKFPQQVHGSIALHYSQVSPYTPADAVYANTPNSPCAIMTADCLPVFIASKTGDEVAVSHAGWRGLSCGILENTIAKFATTPKDLNVFIGPGIGPRNFEVGIDVYSRFTEENTAYRLAFDKISANKWLADLSLLAELRLQKLKIGEISKSHLCTFSNDDLFFSYRRDKTTGRMAAIAWIDP